MTNDTSRYKTFLVSNILQVPQTSLLIRQLTIFFPKLSQALKFFLFITFTTKFALKIRITDLERKLFDTISTTVVYHTQSLLNSA